MGEFIRHTACLNPECSSSDGMAIYSDGSGHCFVCKKNYYPDKDNKTKGNKMQDLVKKEKNSITKEEQDEIKSRTTFEANGYRGISDDILKFFGCRTELDENGEVLKRYYPYTINGELSGYKIRKHPKQFSTIGNVGTKVDLYGSFRFQSGGKYVLLTGGECLLPTTKVLTRSGWVTLEDWDGQEVMTGTGNFEQPFAKVFKEYDGDLCLYKSNGYQLTMTPEHNMLRLDHKKENLIKVKASDKTKKHLNIPLSVRTVWDIASEEELAIRIQVMISADFTLNKDGALRASIKKPRKLERIKKLLDESKVRYVINEMSSKRGYFTVYIHKGHNLDVSKLFSYEKHLKYSRIILDEIVHWDGNHVKERNAIEFSSKEIQNAEFIQTCAHINNCYSSLRFIENKFGQWYTLRISFDKNTCSSQKGFETIKYQGKIACLSTPSGTLLVKEKNSISLTGNCDTHAAFQMLKKYSDSKGSSFVTAVVSPSTGETSAAKQIAHNYEFLNKFENIVIGFDADEAGREGTESIISSLPKGKVKIASWTKAKDPNEYLEKGLDKQFIADFYNAKTYVPAGVVGSSELYNQLVLNAQVERIPLPTFMSKLDTMLGGIELGTIGVFAAGSGAAKTTVANEMLYYWIFNSPYKIGVVSLELTCGQYGQAMLSRHMETKISRIRDANEKIQFLGTDKVKEKAQELFIDSDGNDRFMIIDERDGELSVLQEKIEQLVIACKCKLIILDPVSDLLDGISNEDQALFMKWCKSIIKNYNVTFILISHIRKSSNNKDSASTGAFIPEEAIMGSSTIFKSASWVVMMQRDKYSEDDIKRNTTHLVLSKNRSGGVTGAAGDLFYDTDEHKLYDLEQWMLDNNKQPQKEF